MEGFKMPNNPKERKEIIEQEARIMSQVEEVLASVEMLHGSERQLKLVNIANEMAKDLNRRRAEGGIEDDAYREGHEVVEMIAEIVSIARASADLEALQKKYPKAAKVATSALN